MKKIIFFIVAVFAFSFDIDDLNKGIYALKNGNFEQGFEIFFAGCEAGDTLACEELGYMYINNEVSEKIDTRLVEIPSTQLGIRYLVKSCSLGYLNGCSSILDLAKEVQIPNEVLKTAKDKYDELAVEFVGDLNATIGE
ncbi:MULTISPECIES: hypothetical protein [unclassified Campylobacter]|uniref:hypothetical protein n=1 Tax=unclassified Campylobacter TaxID=2593542 RepID=UPI003D354C7D